MPPPVRRPLRKLRVRPISQLDHVLARREATRRRTAWYRRLFWAAVAFWWAFLGYDLLRIADYFRQTR